MQGETGATRPETVSKTPALPDAPAAAGARRSTEDAGVASTERDGQASAEAPAPPAETLFALHAGIRPAAGGDPWDGVPAIGTARTERVAPVPTAGAAAPAARFAMDIPPWLRGPTDGLTTGAMAALAEIALSAAAAATVGRAEGVLTASLRLDTRGSATAGPAGRGFVADLESLPAGARMTIVATASTLTEETARDAWSGDTAVRGGAAVRGEAAVHGEAAGPGDGGPLSPLRRTVGRITSAQGRPLAEVTALCSIVPAAPPVPTAAAGFPVPAVAVPAVPGPVRPPSPGAPGDQAALTSPALLEWVPAGPAGMDGPAAADSPTDMDGPAGTDSPTAADSPAGTDGAGGPAVGTGVGPDHGPDTAQAASHDALTAHPDLAELASRPDLTRLAAAAVGEGDTAVAAAPAHPLLGAIGATVKSDGERAWVRFRPAPWLADAGGGMHCAAAAALVDAAVATALDRVLPTGSATQVLSVDLCFVRSVPLDREVETVATVFHVGRRLAVVDAEISPTGGRPSVIGRVTVARSTRR